MVTIKPLELEPASERGNYHRSGRNSLRIEKKTSLLNKKDSHRHGYC